MALKEKNIAYLAPAIPALSETFVYNEIFALRERGYKIFPLSIHLPADVSPAVKEKMGPVHYLYKDGVIIFILAFFQCLFTRPMSTLNALGLLISDFFHVGLFNLVAYKLIYQFFAACRAARLFNKNGCEHIHVHFANVPCQVAMHASIKVSIPFFSTRRPSVQSLIFSLAPFSAPSYFRSTPQRTMRILFAGRPISIKKRLLKSEIVTKYFARSAFLFKRRPCSKISLAWDVTVKGI